MRILIDTNILLDHALARMDFFDEAERVLKVCVRSDNETLVTFHTITNAYYVMNRGLDDAAVRKYLTDLAAWVKLTPNNLEQVREALKFSGDLEDDLQWMGARDGKADVIVTRDVKGFVQSSVIVMDPTDFLSNYE